MNQSIWIDHFIDFIPDDKDVELWKLIALTDNHNFCLFAF